MEIFLKTDIGLVRESNQDACKCGMFEDDSLWAVVCDGVGGENAGNIASALAVETIAYFLKDRYKSGLDEEEIYKLLVEIAKEANTAVYESQLKKVELSGMSTTLEFLFIHKNKVHIVHIGDSRVYLVRDKMIKQLTVDHSLVQQMVNNGEITQEEALVHPKKSYLTRALGVLPQVRLDYIETTLEKNDIILMCTDGLTNYLTPQQLVTHCSEKKRRVVVKKLVDSAKALGGSDNITVSVIFY